MDSLSSALADYATNLNFERLSSEAVHAAKRLILDSVGCALSSVECEPALIATRMAADVHSRSGDASIWGTAVTSTAEMAAFANTSMTRYLDFNDCYIGRGDAGHPSDMIPALIAVGEVVESTGKDLITATVVAYEMFCAIMDAMPLRDQGWDQGLYIALGTAVGVGSLLGQSVEQMRETISLALAPNSAIRNTRSGELSLWKGSATAAAARAGIFAAQLATEGMTGPDMPFEGRHGVVFSVTGQSTTPVFGGENRPYWIEGVHLKSLPVEYHLQAIAEAAFKAREQIEPSHIKNIDVGTYRFAYLGAGSEPEKWNPRTRETADHSMPYVLALCLIEGSLHIDSYTDEYLNDPRIRGLMDKISVHEDQECSDAYPDPLRSVLTFTMDDGSVEQFIALSPRGHATNPMTDQEVHDKYMAQALLALQDDAAQGIADRVWNLEKTTNVRELVALIRCT